MKRCLIAVLTATTSGTRNLARLMSDHNRPDPNYVVEAVEESS